MGCPDEGREGGRKAGSTVSRKISLGGNSRGFRTERHKTRDTAASTGRCCRWETVPGGGSSCGSWSVQNLSAAGTPKAGSRQVRFRRRRQTVTLSWSRSLAFPVVVVGQLCPRVLAARQGRASPLPAGSAMPAESTTCSPSTSETPWSPSTSRTSVRTSGSRGR